MTVWIPRAVGRRANRVRVVSRQELSPSMVESKDGFTLVQALMADVRTSES